MGLGVRGGQRQEVADREGDGCIKYFVIPKFNFLYVSKPVSI